MGSPSRHTGMGPRVVTVQKRQQTLRNCLELCESLGFYPAQHQEAQEIDQTPLEVCQYADAADHLFSMKMHAAVKQNAKRFGKLLDSGSLEEMVKCFLHICQCIRNLSDHNPPFQILCFPDLLPKSCVTKELALIYTPNLMAHGELICHYLLYGKVLHS